MSKVVELGPQVSYERQHSAECAQKPKETSTTGNNKVEKTGRDERETTGQNLTTFTPRDDRHVIPLKSDSFPSDLSLFLRIHFIKTRIRSYEGFSSF